ncbi:hypothetical protein ACR6C2_38195 [Streptomyces sp. INA 01156]
MSSPPILTVSGLEVDIAGSHILKGIGFDVPASGVTALLGATASARPPRSARSSDCCPTADG